MTRNGVQNKICASFAFAPGNMLTKQVADWIEGDRMSILDKAIVSYSNDGTNTKFDIFVPFSMGLLKSNATAVENGGAEWAHGIEEGKAIVPAALGGIKAWLESIGVESETDAKTLEVVEVGGRKGFEASVLAKSLFFPDDFEPRVKL